MGASGQGTSRVACLHAVSWFKQDVIFQCVWTFMSLLSLTSGLCERSMDSGPLIGLRLLSLPFLVLLFLLFFPAFLSPLQLFLVGFGTQYPKIQQVGMLNTLNWRIGENGRGIKLLTTAAAAAAIKLLFVSFLPVKVKSLARVGTCVRVFSGNMRSLNHNSPKFPF